MMLTKYELGLIILETSKINAEQDPRIVKNFISRFNDKIDNTSLIADQVELKTYGRRLGRREKVILSNKIEAISGQLKLADILKQCPPIESDNEHEIDQDERLYSNGYMKGHLSKKQYSEAMSLIRRRRSEYNRD